MLNGMRTGYEFVRSKTPLNFDPGGLVVGFNPMKVQSSLLNMWVKYTEATILL